MRRRRFREPLRTQHRVESLCCLALERRRHVAVGVERDGDLRVPEPLLHDLGVDPGGEQEARVRVAQVVEAHPREPDPGDERVEPSAEQVALEEGLPAAVRPW